MSNRVTIYILGSLPSILSLVLSQYNEVYRAHGIHLLFHPEPREAAIKVFETRGLTTRSRGCSISILFSEHHSIAAHPFNIRNTKLSNRPNPTIYYPLLHTIPYDLKKRAEALCTSTAYNPPSLPSPSSRPSSPNPPCRTPPPHLKRTYETIHENDFHFHSYRFQLSSVQRGEKNAARLDKKDASATPRPPLSLGPGRPAPSFWFPAFCFEEK